MSDNTPPAAVAKILKILKTKYGGPMIVTSDHHKYIKDKTLKCSQTITWKCKESHSQKCLGRIHTTMEYEVGGPLKKVVNANHNHLATEQETEVVEFKNNIKEEAKNNPLEKPQNIIANILQIVYLIIVFNYTLVLDQFSCKNVGYIGYFCTMLMFSWTSVLRK